MCGWIKQGVLFALYMGLVVGCATMDSGSSIPHGFTLGQQNGASQTRNLAPGDEIEVSVEVDGSMEVSRHRAKLNHQGIVTLPLVGDVKVGGMKFSAARNIITKTYGAYYVNPPVVILALVDGDIVGEWGFITVLGRVNTPGRVPLQSQEGMNLSAAVQVAGGFATSAKTSDIRVSRTDELGMTTRVSVNFEQIGQTGNANADIMLFDGDIVYVPERIF